MDYDPTYIDDPFEDSESLVVQQANITYAGLAETALQSCKRSGKRFKDEKELHKWQHIEKLLAGDKINFAWIDNCIDWAEQKNAGYRGAIISFMALCSLVGNESKYDAWLSRQRDKNTSGMRTLREYRE
jgi:gluconate kinase